MFKKGDRVRYTGKSKTHVNKGMIGQLGTVIEEEHTKTPGHIHVIWDRGGSAFQFPYTANLERVDVLKDYIQKYKAARAGHERAKEQRKAADRAVQLAAAALQKARDEVLTAIDQETKPE